MANKMNMTELEAFLKKFPDTELLEIAAPDMNGILRGKRLQPEDFAKLFATSGINYCASSVVMDTKGEAFDNIVYGNEDGDPDVIGYAVAGSLAPIPWAAVPSAQVLLELVDTDGTPYFLDPRNVLRNAAQPLADMGLHPVIATELEFYLLEHDGEEFRAKVGRIPGSRMAQSGLQFSSLDDLAEIDPFLADLAGVCRAQNIPAGAALSEYAPGQFEVNLQHVDDPALACDHAVLLKRAVKAVARRNQLAASFMAKPFAEFAGCGMHVVTIFSRVLPQTGIFQTACGMRSAAWLRQWMKAWRFLRPMRILTGAMAVIRMCPARRTGGPTIAISRCEYRCPPRRIPA